MEEMFAEAVWAATSVGLLLGAGLFVLIAGVKAVVLLGTGWFASEAARTGSYADQWVSVAKLGGIGIALGGLLSIIEDHFSQGTSIGAAGNTGVLIAGVGIFVLVEEAVRLPRHYKDTKQQERGRPSPAGHSIGHQD